jgi:Ca2+-binding EF-hand superfamily protein
MGNSQTRDDSCTLSGNLLQEYTDLTPFTRHEINIFYKDFQKLNPSPRNAKTFLAPTQDVAKLPILKCNPFKDRITQVFSNSNSVVSFDDFLDMMTVFHPRTDRTVKLCHAFCIYDFDNDGFLGLEDLKRVIKRMTGQGDEGLDQNGKIIINLAKKSESPFFAKLFFVSLSST